jgi:hypothetical protein
MSSMETATAPSTSFRPLGLEVPFDGGDHRVPQD